MTPTGSQPPPPPARGRSWVERGPLGTKGLSPDRSYASYQAMAKAEAARADGIAAVAIVSPNHMRAATVIAYLDAGIHVICDKPLCATEDEATAISDAVGRSKALFFLTRNYTGYPLIRQAKEIVYSICKEIKNGSKDKTWMSQ